MKTFFIAGIERVAIAEDLGRGDQFMDGFFITNNHDYVKQLLTHEFIMGVGIVEFSSLMKIGAVAYRFDEREPFADGDDLGAIVTQRLAELGSLLLRLWLIRDHAAYTEFGYLEHPHGGGIKAVVTRNVFLDTACKADGTKPSTTFSRSELKTARGIIGEQPTIIVSPQPSVGKAVSRLQRAWYFMQAARAHEDLGVKVANYCTCFESLFSTDPSELSHKLAERLAVFIGTEKTRYELYGRIKKAYSLRSKVVHGSGGADLAALKDAGVLCDDLARQIFLKIFQSSDLEELFGSGSNEKIEEYMIRSVLR